MPSVSCFFCEKTHAIEEKDGIYHFDCAGDFTISKDDYNALDSIVKSYRRLSICWLKAGIRNWIRTRKNTEEIVSLNKIKIQIPNIKPISIEQQKKNLLFLLGERYFSNNPNLSFKGAPEQSGTFRKEMWADMSFCGSANEKQFQLICHSLHEEGFITSNPFFNLYKKTTNPKPPQITEKGEEEYWKQVKYYKSKSVFIAMAYGKEKTDKFYNLVIVPVVKSFKLKPFRMDINNSMTGIIDNSMLYNIQNSKLLIAELSDRNPGAYWEAGYAEGVGIKVLYACEKKQFKKKLHFDVNHRNSILWEEDKLNDARKKLKIFIKNCL